MLALGIATEPKKTILESLAAVAAALGGARTPISQALVELGLFLGLVFTADWVYQHASTGLKPILVVFFMPFGIFIGLFLLIRVMVVIGKEASKK